MTRTSLFGTIGAMVMLEALTPASSASEPRASQQDELRGYLQAFHKNPPEVMGLIPSKWDENGQIVSPAPVLGREEPDSSTLLESKDEVRARLMERALSDLPQLYAAPLESDRVENLVEVPTILRTLGEMERSGYLSSELPRKLWSDSYWPLNRGLSAARYADPGFPNSNSAPTNLDYVLSFPAPAMIASGRADYLSPAEKYDYLIGDQNYTLSHSAWGLVRAAGAVASWAGICDGWSSSTISFDEPVRLVTAVGAGGQSVHFWPSDVKALSALLWAKGVAPVRFIGTRCHTQNPPRDEMGRVLSAECNNTNPGTWHMSVVNQVGQAKRAVVMDATYDFQVWNHPIFKYNYSYFNPQTLQPSKSWRDAVVPINRFSIDKFKKYRSPDAKYVAGISMNVSYMIEVEPTRAQGPRSAHRSVRYVYDLELDGDMRIVGGEWYTNAHPDFLWTPQAGARAVSLGDVEISNLQEWMGTNPVPSSWTLAARRGSQRAQPLAAIVERLISMSSANP